MVIFLKKHIGTRGVTLLACITFALVALLYFMAPPIGVVATIAAIYSGFLFGLLYSYNYRAKAQKNTPDLLQETISYNKISSKILEDRDTIRLEIKVLEEEASMLLSRQELMGKCLCSPIVEQKKQSKPKELKESSGFFSNPNRLFSAWITPLQRSHRETAIRDEMSEQLFTLMYSYPLLDFKCRNEPNYLRTAKNALIEHHLQVLAVKDCLFKAFHKTLDEYERNLNVSRSVV